MFLIAHDIFFKEMEIHRFAIDLFKKLIYIPVLYHTGLILLNDVLDLSITSMVGFCHAPIQKKGRHVATATRP